MKRIVCIVLVLSCITGLCFGAGAAEVNCDEVYCFSAEDFSSDEPITGICITGLPDPESGTIMLGSRVLQPGDILAADQVAQMTFSPLMTENNRDAQVTYLPIYKNRVAPTAVMTIGIRGKTDNAPVAEDSSLETYKNLPNESSLKVKDPEGQPLVYTLTRQPKRGQVELRSDGTFVYTPKKNKVGVDSFTYTATDPAGNVSREATVTVRILKPTDSTQYTDTLGSDCRFAAEWMKNTGLFVGENIGGQQCFQEKKSVSRGEFLTMVVKSLGIPMDENATFTGYTDNTPDWLKPYLAAAMRAGLTASLPMTETGGFGHNAPITGGEAAVLLQNAMDLTVITSGEAPETAVPAWAADALTALSSKGIYLEAEECLNRGQVANLLYQVSLLAQDAPGLRMYQ